MGHKRYWDVSEKDRAAMDDAEFEAGGFEAVELMERGLPVDLMPAAVDPMPEMPALGEETVYQIHAAEPGGTYAHAMAIYYPTAAGAQLFIESGPHGLGGKSDYGRDRDTRYAGPLHKFEVHPVTVYKKGDCDAAKDLLDAREKIEKKNEKALKSYGERMKTREDALRKMREDRYYLRDRRWAAARCAEQFLSYCRTADRDSEVALKFLVKAKAGDETTREALVDASNWDMLVDLEGAVHKAELPDAPSANGVAVVAKAIASTSAAIGTGTVAVGEEF